MNIVDDSTESAEEELTRVLNFDLIRRRDFDEAGEEIEKTEKEAVRS